MKPWDGGGATEPPPWKRVLIVDDNNRYAEALGNQMKAQGARVERAFNATEGVKRLKTGADDFDGIITDISMENQISGLRVLWMAKRSAFRGGVAVATTGLDSPVGYFFNRLFLGVLMRADFLIPKKPIKREGRIAWIPC